ncbi:MAG: M1 family aminopeptidase [Candidatus Acidiferrales bacterium]
MKLVSNRFSMPLKARWLGSLALLLAFALVPAALRGDISPYARSRDYQLESVRTHLRFDLDKRSVAGETTQNLSILRDGISALKFDSSQINIDEVTVNGKKASFQTPENQLLVTLDSPARVGQKFEVIIRYNAQPKKGLYFVLPDKLYPDRPKQVWSQGEDEDTHFYIPIYDYPNNRATSEMILTVPANWVTISNGRLVGVKAEPNGMKTWDWKQSEPMSTYLISLVAGEFIEKDETWRGMPVRFVVPKGDESDISPTFVRTQDMLSTFSDKLGVRYPWAQYAQSMVDDFVVGGMENTSATTLTSRGLINPKQESEFRAGSDGLLSHEMAHQWFGDLLTTKDWANLWLNEGFATYFEHFWNESHYGKDAVDYEFWQERSGWFQEQQLYTRPIVDYSITNSLELSGNIYTKGGWVLKMLRSQIGDENFWNGMHHYLEAHRLQNVVTADLEKSIEEATGVNTDEFFNQWVYGAGAPKFQISSAYDDGAKKVNLTVKQTQKVEGHVGIFHVPVEVEIATASGRKTFPIDVSKADETLSFAVDGPPLMVLFDKGDKILKSVEFNKTPQEWIYQLKNAENVADRADAAVALGKIKDNEDAVAALGQAATNDPFWGVRIESLRALGSIGGASAEKQILAAVSNEQPWVREVAVSQLGHFKDDASLPAKLESISRDDTAWRVRASALRALGQAKSKDAFDVLSAALTTDSPDDTLRSAGLNGLGALGDDRAVPLVEEWAAPGKPLNTRGAAIFALSGLDKKNTEITLRIASYLDEPYSDVRFPCIFALGQRGDPAAIPALEKLLHSPDLSIGIAPLIQGQIDGLKAAAAGNNPGGAAPGAGPGESAKPGENADVMQALEKLQQQIAEMNERLQKIETQLAGGKK